MAKHVHVLPEKSCLICDAPLERKRHSDGQRESPKQWDSRKTCLEPYCLGRIRAKASDPFEHWLKNRPAARKEKP